MSAPIRVPGITLRYDAKRPGLGWGVFVDVRLNGKRHSPSKFFATEAEAEVAYASAAAEVARLRAEAAEQAAITRALNVPALPQAPKGVVLFGPMTERWLAEHIQPPRKAASTYLGYQRLLKNHLLPVMRTWPMTGDVMSKQRVAAVLKTTLYAKGVSLTTRVACKRCLGSFFDWALTELPPKDLQINPVARLKTDLLRQPEEIAIRLLQEPNPMTRVQVEA